METTLSVIFLGFFAVVVTSAPTLPEGPVAAMEQERERILQDYFRDRRSQYQQYGTPCAAAAAASAAIPTISQPIAPAAYQVNLSPYHPYGVGPIQHGYYGVPHYRSTEFEPEQEMMSFSDMDHMMSEHMPMARYGYGVPSAPIPVSAPARPAYGVFPNAKTGGCSVPLLLSCSPSIVTGHVIPSQPQPQPQPQISHNYANSYRNVDPGHQPEPQDSHEAIQEHLTPVHESSHTSQATGHNTAANQ